MMNTIPHKIHQVYTRGMAALPAEVHASIDSLRQLNPDWEYYFYDEKKMLAYLHEHYGQEILALYEKINPQYGAARADFFRYLLMYREGGVYLDIKSSCTVPFSEVIPPDCEILLCNWDNKPQGCDNNMGKHEELAFLKNGEYQQWNIIVAPASPYIKAVIDEVVERLKRYKPWRYGVGMRGVLNTTGPIPFTLGIEKVRKCERFRQRENHRDVGLVYRNVSKKVIKQFNASHYSKLRTPVVTLTGADHFYYLLWRAFVFPFWRLKKNTINESRKVLSKLKSRCT
ncbi:MULTISPECIES: glycosyltransferase [unclassified Kosakonia]|uniref:glycosyltransferase family 32 protein n=1 Tax=unclassified Kosakonia TaxID=2632876 RepID=UPI0031B676A1